MQVFKTYFKLLKSKLSSLMIYIIVFLFLVIANSLNSKIDNEQFEASKVNIMIVNEDGQSSLLDGFITYLKENAKVIETAKDAAARKDALFYREVEYILTIPKGFTDSFQRGGTIRLTKQIVPDSTGAVTIDNTIDNYLNLAKVYLKYMPKISAEQLNSYLEQNLAAQTQVTMTSKVQDKVSNSNKINNNYFNYLGYIMIAGFILGVSTVMLTFRSIDIRRRHFASPLSNRSMNLQLILANLMFVISFSALFIAVGYFMNTSRVMNINTLLYWLNAFVFALLALSISYLVGITVESRNAITMISTALSLGLSFLSGIFVPQELLGASVLKVASFTPTYWYVKANNTIQGISTLQSDELLKLAGYMAIQLGFAAAILSIALVISKRKSQQAG